MTYRERIERLRRGDWVQNHSLGAEDAAAALALIDEWQSTLESYAADDVGYLRAQSALACLDKESRK